MSGKLVAEVLDRAPPDLPPRHHIVWISIAEKARDESRCAWPGHDVLARRAHCSERTIRGIIADLISRGLIVERKRATAGRKASYEIPQLETLDSAFMPEHPCRGCGKPVERKGSRGPWPTRCPDCAASVGNQVAASVGNQVAASAGNQVAASVGNQVAASAGNPGFPPVPHVPQKTLISPVSTAFIELRRVVPDVTERETETALGILKDRGAGSSLAVLRREIKDGAAPELVDEARAKLAAANGSTVGKQRSIPDQLEELRRGPPCVHGDPGGANLHPLSGTPLCPQCRSEQAAES